MAVAVGVITVSLIDTHCASVSSVQQAAYAHKRKVWCRTPFQCRARSRSACAVHTNSPKHSDMHTNTNAHSLRLCLAPFFHTYKHTWHMRIHNRVPLWTVAMQHFSDWVSWALVHVHSQTHTHILLLAYEYQITHIILCHTHPPRLPQDTAALPRPRMEWGETQGSPGGEKPCVGLCSSQS